MRLQALAVLVLLLPALLLSLLACKLDTLEAEDG